MGKVEIDESLTPIRFFQVATLVDRPDFIRRVKYLRQKWGLHNKLVPNDDRVVNEWKKQTFSLNDQEYAEWQEAEKIFCEKYEKKGWVYSPLEPNKQIKYDNDLQKLMRSKKDGDFDWDIQKIRNKLSRPPRFTEIIERAVICGSVTKENILPVFVTIRKPEREFFSLPNESEEIVMVLDQFVTEDEVVEAFRKQYKLVRDKYPKSYEVYGIAPKNPRRIPEIKRNREWHWRNVGGESVKDIAYSVLPEKEKETLGNNWTKYQLKNYRGVANAIAWYRNLLQ